MFKIYGLWWWVGGLQDFNVSPSPLLGLLGMELGWDWVWGDWRLRGWGLGLDNFGFHVINFYVSAI